MKDGPLSTNARPSTTGLRRQSVCVYPFWADFPDGAVGIEAQHGVPVSSDRAVRRPSEAREHVVAGGEDILPQCGSAFDDDDGGDSSRKSIGTYLDSW